jgi:hypothetical protein
VSKRLLSGLIVVSLIGAAAWYWSMRSGPAESPVGGGAVPAERRVAVAPKVSGVMLVNDAREARLGRATPIFVECILTNPTGGTLPVQASALGLEVRAEDGTLLPVEWERVGEVPEAIDAGASVGVRWVATSQMPVGRFEIGVSGAASAADPQVARVWVDLALVTVADAGDTEADEAAAIQFLAWRGQADAALVRIDAALAGAPGSLVLQLWRADLLRDLGREAEAIEQYSQLAAAIEARQRARGDDAVELPFWLAERLAAR